MVARRKTADLVALAADRPADYLCDPRQFRRKEPVAGGLNALADLPVTVIAATAGRNHLKNVPANAFVADYLPGEAAAARSAVVLCNGGSPTTQQALAAGVPVIGLPATWTST